MMAKKMETSIDKGLVKCIAVYVQFSIYKC